MGAISQTNTRSLADVEAQMDADGVLFPDAQDALRQEITSVEPLFESDPVLQEHLTRFIGLSGVGSGTYYCQSLTEHREFFASLERRLLEMLPRGEGSIPSPEHVAKISSIIDSLHRTELCLELARNGYLSAELFHKTEAYVRQLSHRVQSICDSVISETLQSPEAAQFVEAVVDLRDLPRRMRLLVTLAFQCSDTSEIKPGDTLSVDRIGRYVVLEELRSGEADLIECDLGRVRYQRYRGDLRNLEPSRLFVTRGIGTLIPAGEEPFSRLQPFRTGVHVMRPPSRSHQRAHEVGEIIGFRRDGQYAGSYEVLWKGADFSATVTCEREEDLRVLGRGDTPAISGSLAAQALTDDRRSPLYTFVRAESPQFQDRDARELTSLCTAILSAEYPLAVHVMGAERTRGPVVEQLSSRVAMCSQGGLPEEDPSFLRRHGCTPVLVIVDSQDHQYLTQEIKELREKGWEIILCSDLSMIVNDKYVEHAIADLSVLMGQGAATVVDISESLIAPVSAVLEAMGARAKQALDAQIGQRTSHTEAQRKALDSLADALDGLAESDPTKTITRHPDKLHYIQHAVAAIRRGELQVARESIESCAELLGAPPRAEHGVTLTQGSWSFKELIELSAALAKSRLSPDHPAVLLRGVTCLDLSPAALAQLLQQGGQIFRHVDHSGVTRSMIISLPPSVTDATRPGLSASLGHENSVGYIYWIWVDPDGTEDVRAAYTKLLNRVVLEQLAEGATFVFGRVLERNAPSLFAVRSIGGFEIIPTRAIIGGEPAVAVGVDISPRGLEAAEKTTALNPRAVLSEALNVFTSGLHDLSADEERRAAQGLRISVTHEFLVHAYSFRSACEQVLTFVTNDLRWSDGYRVILEAEEALERFSPWLTEAQKKDILLALNMCTDDQDREAGKAALRRILDEVIPEGLKTLSSNHSRLREKALESLGIELDVITPRNPPEGQRKRKDTLPIPSRVDVEATRKAFKQMLEREQWILDSWWDWSHQKFCWVRDSHPDVYGCHRILREWIEGDIEERDAFCSPPRIPESKNGETAEATRKHFEEFAQIIEWANEVARAGHFDQHVAAFLRPIIDAFLGRKP